LELVLVAYNTSLETLPNILETLNSLDLPSDRDWLKTVSTLKPDGYSTAILLDGVSEGTVSSNLHNTRSGGSGNSRHSADSSHFFQDLLLNNRNRHRDITLLSLDDRYWVIFLDLDRTVDDLFNCDWYTNLDLTLLDNGNWAVDILSHRDGARYRYIVRSVDCDADRDINLHRNINWDIYSLGNTHLLGDRNGDTDLLRNGDVNIDRVRDLDRHLHRDLHRDRNRDLHRLVHNVLNSLRNAYSDWNRNRVRDGDSLRDVDSDWSWDLYNTVNSNRDGHSNGYINIYLLRHVIRNWHLLRDWHTLGDIDADWDGDSNWDRNINGDWSINLDVDRHRHTNRLGNLDVLRNWDAHWNGNSLGNWNINVDLLRYWNSLRNRDTSGNSLRNSDRDLHWSRHRNINIVWIRNLYDLWDIDRNRDRDRNRDWNLDRYWNISSDRDSVLLRNSDWDWHRNTVRDVDLNCSGDRHIDLNRLGDNASGAEFNNVVTAIASSLACTVTSTSRTVTEGCSDTDCAYCAGYY